MKKDSYGLVHVTRAFKPLWLVSLSMMLIIIVLPLTRQGMFLDGIIYAAIAKNLSLGHGSVWQPFYSQTDFSIFYEHPPLAFYFQSFFFKFLGQEFRAEQFYSFLMGLGQFSLIAWYWLKKESAPFYTLGLLLFLWLLVPLNHLYTCNMLEGTLTLFTTMASLLLLVRTQSFSTFFLQQFICSIAVLIAFLANGPTAIFPLVVPMLKCMLDTESSIFEGVKETLFFALMLVLVFCCFYLWVPEALVNTKNYFQQQLLPSVIGSRQLNFIGLKHLNILHLYIRACLPVSIFAALCVFLSAKIKGSDFISELKGCPKGKNFLIFFLLSLASSLPVGVSHRHAFNYIMQCAPFITLAMMWFCFEPVKLICHYCYNKPLLFKRISIICYCLITACFMSLLYLANGYNRQKEMINDINYLTHYFKNDPIISASSEVYYSWYTGAYFSRHSLISLTPTEGQVYYLALKKDPIPKDYRLIKLNLSFYNLARHI